MNIEYYRMESVRDIIIAGNYTVKTDHERPVPLPGWNKYPLCPILNKCKQESCVGYVSVFVNTETVRWLYLEICFVRKKQKAFIRTQAPQMMKLFELGIIKDESQLCKETL